MKAEDLRSKTEDELKDELLKIRKDLLNIRFQKVSGQVDSISKIPFLKKDIARIKTILTEKSKLANK